MVYDFLLSHYDWIKAFHVIAVISWIAGMLYLPRLFVYHAIAARGSETSETFKAMERRLLKYIINPAMIATFVFGASMFVLNIQLLYQPWMHVKLGCVLLLAGLHGFFAKTVRVFAKDENTRSQKFYRYINEVPAILMVIIVIMVVVRPF